MFKRCTFALGRNGSLRRLKVIGVQFRSVHHVKDHISTYQHHRHDDASIVNLFEKHTDLKNIFSTGINNLLAKIKYNNNADKFKFQFKLLRNLCTNNNDFFINNEYELLKILKNLQKKLISKLKNAEISVVSKSAKFEDYINPNDENFSSIIYGLITSKDVTLLPIDPPNLSGLKINESSMLIQEKFNYILEQIFYNNLKPLRSLDNIKQFNHVKSTSNTTFKIVDITNPVEWFPNARKLKRNFIMHVGPTNSGKTYNALQKLENCNKGYYAGPLRLLAREVFDKIRSKGIRCNLLTGEEVIPDIDDFGNISGITSGTVEMVSLNEEYDVIVLDEIQMISDEYRGWAWTNVVLGARAKEIHLCGELSSVPLIKKIVQLTGDNLEINEYNRLGKLEVCDTPIINLTDFRKGDCIVSFSKKKILDIKAFIEQKTNFKCGVIYGALPPETRAQEALKFNSGEYDLLIASDAVGMGLNLKIRRIIFTTMQKFDGKSRIQLSDSSVKQIGGRAGRFGFGKNSSDTSTGYITSIDGDVLEIVRDKIDSPIQYIPQACLWIPDFLWVKYFSMFSKETKLFNIYDRFEMDLKELKYKQKAKALEGGSNDSSLFFISSLDEVKQVSRFFNGNELKNGNFLIFDQFRLIKAPFFFSNNDPTRFKTKNDINYQLSLNADYTTTDFIKTIINREPKSIIDFKLLFNLYRKDSSISSSAASSLNYDSANSQYAESVETLKKLETLHKEIMLFLWMSYRYPKNFIDLESALKVKELVEDRITKELEELRSDKIRRNKFSFA